MAELVQTQQPTRSFWIISGLSLVWNLIGVGTYLATVMATPESLAALPDAERALYTDVPTWATSAFAIAVFVGVLGSVLLLMRRSLAVQLFIVSLVAIVVQMVHALFLSPMLEVLGGSAAVMPILVTAVGAYLVWFATKEKNKGVLR